MSIQDAIEVSLTMVEGLTPDTRLTPGDASRAAKFWNDHVAQEQERNPNAKVKVLDLSNYILPPESLEPLGPFFKCHRHTIEVLRASHITKSRRVNDLTIHTGLTIQEAADTFHKIAETFSRGRFMINTIDVSRNYINDLAGMDLVSLFGLPHVDKINVSRCEFSDNIFRQLMVALRGKHIVQLKMVGNNFKTGDAHQYIAELFKNYPGEGEGAAKLKEVDLCPSRLQSRFLVSIFQGLSEMVRSCQRSISGNVMGLEELRLTGIGIGNEVEETGALEYMVFVFAALPQLRILDLSQITLSEEDLRQLLHALVQSGAQLAHLCLCDDDLNNEHCNVLSSFYNTGLLAGLKELALSGNFFNGGLGDLLSGIEALGELKTLRLDYCYLDEDDILPLVENRQALAGLECLDLRNNEDLVGGHVTLDEHYRAGVVMLGDA